MPNEIFFSVYASPSGGFAAKAVGHPILTQGETLEALKVNTEEVVRRHFAGMETPPSIHLIDVQPDRRFRFGSAKGEFTVPDDFNDPLPKEIEDLFYGE